MNIRRLLCVASVLTCLTVLAPAAWAISVSSYSYAAIAYSPSTGKYRYSYNYGSRWSAEQAALSLMTEDDAKIVCWVNHGFCALAVGDDQGCYGTGWTYGGGAGNREAMDRALENCRQRTTGARVVLCLVSDGQYIYEFKPAKPDPTYSPVDAAPPAPTASGFAPATPSMAPVAPAIPSYFNPEPTAFLKP